MIAKLAVLGDPIAHSLSPAMHNAALAFHGIQGQYEAIQCNAQQLSQQVESLRSLGYLGINLTLPLKQRALALCDRLEPAAKFTGAVNCLSLNHPEIHGVNTDVLGFCADLQANQWRLADKHVVILGAGGAARSAVYAALQLKARRIDLIQRTTS